MGKMRKIQKIAAIAGALAILAPGLALARAPYYGVSGNTSKSDERGSNRNETIASRPARARTWNGTVTGVSAPNVTFTAKNGGTYTADTTNAKLVRKFGAAMNLSDLQTGDIIQVRGTAASGTPTQITASMLRDMSLQARNGTFTGTVQSTGTNSFTMQSKSRGTQTVNYDSTTVFKKNGQTASSTDLAQGQTVTVTGVWDRTNSNVTAKTVRIIIRMNPLSFTGTVSAVSGNTLTVSASGSQTYAVDVTGAKIYNSKGVTISASDIKQNDTVLVRGTHVVNSTNVTAKTVRDTSITQ